MTRIITKNRRKAALFLIVLFILFAFTSTYIQPAQAIAGVDDLAIAFVVSMLISAGVTFATAESAADVAQQFMDDNGISGIETALIGARYLYDLYANRYKIAIGISSDLWTAVKTWVDEHFDVGQNLFDTATNYEWFKDVPYYFLGASGNGQITIIENSGSYVYITYDGADDKVWYRKYSESDSLLAYNSKSMNGLTPVFKISTYNSTYDCIDIYGETSEGVLTTISRYFAIWQPANDDIYYQSIVQNEITGYPGIVDNPTYSWTNSMTDDMTISIPLDETDEDMPGYVPDIEVPIGDDTIGLDVPDSTLEDIVGQTPIDITEQDVGGVEVGTPSETYTDEITESLPEEYQPTETQTRSLKALFITKFPFCIPWDIKNAISLLAASSQAPQFTVDPLSPFVGDGVAPIAFDFEEYAVIGTVCRWFFTVEFCIMLAAGTKKLIWG